MTIRAMPLKTVALVGAVCLTTGWLLASMLAPPVAKLQALPERRAARPPSSSELPLALSEQLHWRLQQAPVPPTTRRNPFVFATPTRRPDRPGPDQAPTETPVLEAPVAAPPVGPIYSLSGIGVSQTPQGEGRTAILSDGTTVHLVKIGDTIGGYKVQDVTDTSVTLLDAAGVPSVLRLRN